MLFWQRILALCYIVRHFLPTLSFNQHHLYLFLSISLSFFFVSVANFLYKSKLTRFVKSELSGSRTKYVHNISFRICYLLSQCFSHCLWIKFCYVLGNKHPLILSRYSISEMKSEAALWKNIYLEDKWVTEIPTVLTKMLHKSV